ITENGYIVTNAHVIYDSEYNSGLSKDITVVLNGEKRYEAEVIGYDRDCDLAVLKIDETGLTAAEFGDSDSLKLGESVTAIGNPLGFDLMNTVTRGIVSGMNRQITINDKAMNLIQTDAAINSGNSGGPLINKYGQVIGINSSKMSASYSETSIEGIGFAIPSNEVSKIIDDIMEYGYVTGKPQLGISCQDVNETISQMYNLPVGVYITEVTDGSAADEAGLRSGDVITAVDGTEVKTAEELNIEKNKHEAGDSIEITYVRSGKTETTDVVLDEYINE
ncbi:MAG: trypsin-like peptidase domain-containing protein, partial [Eubacterium sp.]|nr:trypsin-like peptidase domain-containing protein [Eubacterium sp.]